MDLMKTNQGGGGSSSPLLRDYRKGNWTLQETMVLIEAKKMDEERWMKRQVGESSEGSTKPAELRWKWVEDYCWRNGCLRSQNQCNDKWDNLMRDFKKVRDFGRRINDEQQKVEQCCSYWKMEKSERKDKNLPSNMLPQIYEALVDVVERKGQRFFGTSGGGGASSSCPNIMSSMLGQVACNVVPVSLSTALQRQMSSPPPPVPPQQQPPQQQPTPPPQPLLPPPFSQPLAISDSDTSEYSDSPAKRRRRGKEIEGEDQRTRSTTPIAFGLGGGGTTTDSQQLDDSAITKSASLIVGAIQASEEREERRHKELLNMQERRLQIEESKAEINRQGISGLVHAINNLAHSLLAMASNKNQPTPPPPK